MILRNNTCSKQQEVTIQTGKCERIKCPGEEKGTDKASVMIIAVCQLPRRRKCRMRLLEPENGHKG